MNVEDVVSAPSSPTVPAVRSQGTTGRSPLDLESGLDRSSSISGARSAGRRYLREDEYATSMSISFVGRAEGRLSSGTCTG